MKNPFRRRPQRGPNRRPRYSPSAEKPGPPPSDETLELMYGRKFLRRINREAAPPPPPPPVGEHRHCPKCGELL